MAQTSTTGKAIDLPVVDFAAFEELALPERQTLLTWLLEGGLAMVYGPRGIGKTYFVLSLATSLVTGECFIKWPVGVPVGVLMVDGEMSVGILRDRFRAALRKPPVAPLEILSHEILFDRLEEDLDLGKVKWQRAILDYLEKHPQIRVVIFDNLSCLLPSVQEDKRDEWAERVLPFLIRLRRRGIAVILVHHAGKGGDQRGTSAHEDPLDTVIRLDELPDHDATQGAAFRITFTKARGVFGDDLATIEARLEATSNDHLTWTWKPAEESNKERLLALVRDGVTSVTNAAEELELTKGAVSKLKKKLQNEGRLRPGRGLVLA